jgi:hypothetical protein
VLLRFSSVVFSVQECMKSWGVEELRLVFSVIEFVCRCVFDSLYTSSSGCATGMLVSVIGNPLHAPVVL